MPNVNKQLISGAIFDFHGLPFRPSRRKQRSIRHDLGVPFRDPAFNEIMVIPVPFGPIVFLNVILFMMIG